jgi:hypothetical protein
MTQVSGSRWRCFAISFIIVFWFSAANAGDSVCHKSPQSVFKVAQEAGYKKDFGTLTKLTAPTERPLLAFSSDMAVGMFVEFYEGEKASALKEKYAQIQKKHGIKNKDEDDGEKLRVTKDTPQEVIDAHIRKRANRLYGKVDAVNYVPDLMEIVVYMPEMADQSFFSSEKLADLKIEGDRATGKAGDKTMSFIRENGCWYLTADVMD